MSNSFTCRACWTGSATSSLLSHQDEEFHALKKVTLLWDLKFHDSSDYWPLTRNLSTATCRLNRHLNRLLSWIALEAMKQRNWVVKLEFDIFDRGVSVRRVGWLLQVKKKQPNAEASSELTWYVVLGVFECGVKSSYGKSLCLLECFSFELNLLVGSRNELNDSKLNHLTIKAQPQHQLILRINQHRNQIHEKYSASKRQTTRRLNTLVPIVLS